jgi:hypothetical protein
MIKYLELIKPKGRAFSLRLPAPRALFEASAVLFEDCRIYAKAVIENWFPTLMSDEAVPPLERMFGIFVSEGTTMTDRKKALDTVFLENGSAAPGSVQEVLTKAGFSVVVRENYPVEDLLVADEAQYGYDQYGYVQYGSSTLNNGYLLGNGSIKRTDGSYYDPVNAPSATGAGASNYGFANYGFANYSFGNTSERWTFCWVIEGPGGTMGSVDASRRLEFERLLLKLKQAHTAIFVKVNYT